MCIRDRLLVHFQFHFLQRFLVRIGMAVSSKIWISDTHSFSSSSVQKNNKFIGAAFLVSNFWHRRQGKHTGILLAFNSLTNTIASAIISPTDIHFNQYIWSSRQSSVAVSGGVTVDGVYTAYHAPTAFFLQWPCRGSRPTRWCLFLIQYDLCQSSSAVSGGIFVVWRSIFSYKISFVSVPSLFQ